MNTSLELIFLHSLGTPLYIHKSQFEEFAKAMFQAGYFQKNSNLHERFAPKESFNFYRLMDKSGMVWAPYIWPKDHTVPKPIKTNYFNWGEWMRDGLKKSAEKEYRKMMLGNFDTDVLNTAGSITGRVTNKILFDDKLCPP